MQSFFDDLLEFGAGALDSVGENADWLFDDNDQSSNPDTTQQPNHPVVDNRGNAVTTPQGDSAPAITPMMWYVGGGLGVLFLLLLTALAFRK